MEDRNRSFSIVVFVIMLVVVLACMILSYELHDIHNNTPAALRTLFPLLFYSISACTWLIYEQFKAKEIKSINYRIFLWVVVFQLVNILWICSIRN